MAASGVMLRISRISIEDDGDARMSFSGEKTDRRRGTPGGGSSELLRSRMALKRE
jgi:hypothetical protein